MDRLKAVADHDAGGFIGWLLSSTFVGAIFGAAAAWARNGSRVRSHGHRLDKIEERGDEFVKKLDRIGDDVSHIKGYLEAEKDHHHAKH